MQQQSLVEYGSRRVIITVTAIICALLEIVDTTIVNVALNDMKGNLGATTNEIGWVVTAYAIGNVIIIPMTSWLRKRFGPTAPKARAAFKPRLTALEGRDMPSVTAAVATSTDFA